MTYLVVITSLDNPCAPRRPAFQAFTAPVSGEPLHYDYLPLYSFRYTSVGRPKDWQGAGTTWLDKWSFPRVKDFEYMYIDFFSFFFWSSSSLSTERHFVFGACAPLGEIWLETTTSACLRPWVYHLLQLFRIKVQNWLFSTSVCRRGKCSRYNNLVLGFVLNFQMFCSVSFPLKDNFLCVQTEGRSHEPRWQLMKWLISTWMSRDSLSLLRLTPRNWKKKWGQPKN